MKITGVIMAKLSLLSIAQFDILAKTWNKMSPKGHEAALALNPPKAVVDLLHQGLAALAAAG